MLLLWLYSLADWAQKGILYHQLDDGTATLWGFLLRVEDVYSPITLSVSGSSESHTESSLISHGFAMIMPRDKKGRSETMTPNLSDKLGGVGHCYAWHV